VLACVWTFFAYTLFRTDAKKVGLLRPTTTTTTEGPLATSNSTTTNTAIPNLRMLLSKSKPLHAEQNYDMYFDNREMKEMNFQREEHLHQHPSATPNRQGKLVRDYYRSTDEAYCGESFACRFFRRVLTAPPTPEELRAHFQQEFGGNNYTPGPDVQAAAHRRTDTPEQDQDEDTSGIVLEELAAAICDARINLGGEEGGKSKSGQVEGNRMKIGKKCRAKAVREYAEVLREEVEIVEDAWISRLEIARFLATSTSATVETDETASDDEVESKIAAIAAHLRRELAAPGGGVF